MSDDWQNPFIAAAALAGFVFGLYALTRLADVAARDFARVCCWRARVVQRLPCDAEAPDTSRLALGGGPDNPQQE